jgi:hypothetical protein
VRLLAPEWPVDRTPWLCIYEEQAFASTEGRYGSVHNANAKLSSLIKDVPVATGVPNPHLGAPVLVSVSTPTVEERRGGGGETR